MSDCNLRANILTRACLGRVDIGSHVTRATPPSCHNGCLEVRSLKVRGLETGRFGSFGNVTGTAAAGRGHARHIENRGDEDTGETSSDL
jgi:hypothetical protein